MRLEGTAVIMRESYIFPTLLLTLPISSLSCDARAPFVGTWDLEVIENVPIDDAGPGRIELPEADYGGMYFAEGDVWSESRALQVTLEFRAEGDFRERSIQQRSIVMTPEAYRRATGRVHRGGGAIRADQGIDTSRVIGQWTVEGDSVFLTATREQVEASLAAGIHEMLPDLSQEEIRRRVARMMDESGLEIPIRLRGTVTGDRLSAVDPDGRQLVFRRAAH